MEDVFFTGIVAEHAINDVYDDGVVEFKYVSNQRKAHA